MKKRLKKFLTTSLTMILLSINICNINALESSDREEKIQKEKFGVVTQKEGIIKKQLKKTKEKTAYNNKKVVRYDIENPNNYRTVNKGEKIDTLYDSYGTRHNLYFRELNDYDYYWMELALRDTTDYAYLKDEIVSVELYTNEGGYLDYAGYIDFDTIGMTQASVSTTIEKHLFENQKYVYMIIGVSEYHSDIYSDYTLLKVKNPFAKDFAGHWAESIITNFMDKGIVASTTQFRPNDSITRAEFVKILNKVFGLTRSSGKVFSDTRNHWAKYEIDIAVTNGVCSGKTVTEFKPNDSITREEASVMISNYKKISNNNFNILSTYKDAYKVASWAKPGVEGVLKKEYMSGYSDNTFRPKSNITRSEAVATFSRIK